MKINEFGSRLKELRKESGLTINQISEKSGYTEVHIHEMESENSMSITSLCCVLEAYGYEIEFVPVT